MLGFSRGPIVAVDERAPGFHSIQNCQITCKASGGKDLDMF